MNDTGFHNKLDSKEIVIWGARMTGIGLIRYLEFNNLNTVGIVDSDKSLIGKRINNLVISEPKTLEELNKKYKDLLVVVAVALKEDEILKTLNSYNIKNDQYIIYSDYCDNFYTIDVVGTCNLRCPSCARSLVDGKKNVGFMSLTDFKQVCEKIIQESKRFMIPRKFYVDSIFFN